VALTARNLDAPEGICRNSPKAGDEDDEGDVRSEGSGPQSWARAVRATATMGDLRSTNARADEAATPASNRHPIAQSQTSPITEKPSFMPRKILP